LKKHQENGIRFDCDTNWRFKTTKAWKKTVEIECFSIRSNQKAKNEELFTSIQFRLDYDTLKKEDPLHATRNYLKVLSLAAKESEVEAALKELHLPTMRVRFEEGAQKAREESPAGPNGR
jgi:DNA repair exonuclease SbcCD nuclease subunit